jgi:hypothetical protein
MKFYYLLLVTILCTNQAIAQRGCQSVLNLEEMQLKNPQQYSKYMEINKFTEDFIKNPENAQLRLVNDAGIIVIPVVVHILHLSGDGIGSGRNLSLQRIQNQIDVLNADFRRFNADAINTPAPFAAVAADFGFEFRLACQDPNGNFTQGVTRTITQTVNFANPTPNVVGISVADETAMGIKMTSIAGRDPWPTNRYLNIWSCSFSDETLGYGSYPHQYSANPNLDGVVIRTNVFGNSNPLIQFPDGNLAAGFNRGRTATHEVGHWLNLKHLWGSSTATCQTDDISDTPIQLQGSSGCPTFPQRTSCNNTTNGEMFMNYMDWTNDACMNMFTAGQRA